MSTHPRPTGRTRTVAVAALATVLSLGLVACGDDGDSQPRTDAAGTSSINRSGVEPSATGEPSDTATTEVDPAVIADRKDPVPGVVEVEGQDGSLTSGERAAFARTDPGITVTESSSGDTRGFQRLCIGDVDIVDSSRPMSAEEYEQCRRYGLDVVQFQVAADAVVLAIRSQTDVGADCLSTDQIRASFRAGSEITTWDQLGPGFDDVKFEAGGPTVDTVAGRFFGAEVLDAADPVNADFRVDYAASDSENRTLGFVTGSDRDRLKVRDLAFLRPEWTKQSAQVKKSNAEYERAQEELRAALAEQRKGIRDKRSPAARAKDDARVTRAYANRGREITELNADKARFKPLDKTYKDLLQRQRRIEDEYGHVGVFSHGYYATYEDRLRPFEVQVSDGDDQPNCIFPSPQTILNGQYPLSRRLLLTVTTRSLQRPEVRTFLADYLQRAEQLSTDAGVVALPRQEIARQAAWLEDGAVLPRFGVVNGEVTELTEETDAPTEEPPAAPVQNPAR